ncbi:hypothetical protein EH227_07320 [Rouxiella chamberiensis]|nr:hypothetical protein EH227_07320 [Rouxiella chamberiensis]
MKKLLIAVLALGLVGCTTSPVTSDQASHLPSDRTFAFGTGDHANSGALSVTRDSGLLGGGCYLGFYIDGQLAAKFDTAEKGTFYVKPGEHVIGIGNPGGAGLCNIAKGYRREISIVVSQGETKKFRLTTRQGDGAAVEPSTL